MQTYSQEPWPRPPWNPPSQQTRRIYPSPRLWPPLPSRPPKQPPPHILHPRLDQPTTRHPLQAPQRENNPRHLLCQVEAQLQQAEMLHRRAEHFRELAKAELRQAAKLEEQAWQWARDLEQGRLRALEAARQAVVQREEQQVAAARAEVRRRVEEARRGLAQRAAAVAEVDPQVLQEEEEEAAAAEEECQRLRGRKVRFHLPMDP